MAEGKEDPIKQGAKEVAVTLAKDIYGDALKPAVQRSGRILDTYVGFFESFLLPLQAYVMMNDARRDAMKIQIAAALERRQVPPGRLQVPPLHIGGPALQAMLFAEDAPELADLSLAAGPPLCFGVAACTAVAWKAAEWVAEGGRKKARPRAPTPGFKA